MRCELCKKRRAEHMHHFHHGIHRKTPVGEVVNGLPQRLIPLCIYCHTAVHQAHSKKFKEHHGRERGEFIYIRGESQPASDLDAGNVSAERGWPLQEPAKIF